MTTAASAGTASMQDKLDSLLQQARSDIAAADNVAAVEQLRVQYLGKKGALTDLLKSVSQLSPAERPVLGKAINEAKQQLVEQLKQRESDLQATALAEQLQSETIDVTLPGRSQSVGSLHPVNQVTTRVCELFQAMGFQVAEGPEIEDDFHNFEALNFTVHHPARQAIDTFYFPNGRLLRTHTSPVQIRVLKDTPPPVRVITPGRVFRRDSDPTHTPMFHQLEALVVDRECTFANLKEVLQTFFSRFFETEVTLRFRPSYFPFTEPSAEVDLQHNLCKGKGCRVCGNSGWLEVLGCGMVHPNVLRNVNIDPEEFSGYAFGLGLDRLAMLRYGIDDLRMMFENDLRFLQQF